MNTATDRPKAPTGVEEHRRRLTDGEITRGDSPEPFTEREWKAMARTSCELHASTTAAALADALDGGPRAITRAWESLGRLANALGGRFAR